MSATSHAAAESGAALIAKAAPPVSVSLATIADGVVRVWASGGEDGKKYKFTITVTCANGWIEEQEIVVKVKEV